MHFNTEEKNLFRELYDVRIIYNFFASDQRGHRLPKGLTEVITYGLISFASHWFVKNNLSCRSSRRICLQTFSKRLSRDYNVFLPVVFPIRRFCHLSTIIDQFSYYTRATVHIVDPESVRRTENDEQRWGKRRRLVNGSRKDDRFCKQFSANWNWNWVLMGSASVTNCGERNVAVVFIIFNACTLKISISN